MPVQYLYPQSGRPTWISSSTLQYSNFASDTSESWNLINNGVETPNDVTYVELDATDNFGWLILNLNNMSVIPDGDNFASVRLRYSNNFNSTDLRLNFVGLAANQNGVVVAPNAANWDYSGFATLPYTGFENFTNINVPLTGTQYGFSGQNYYNNLIGPQFGSGSALYLNFNMPQNDTSMYLSEVEVVISGSYIIQPILNTSLFINSNNGKSSGTNLYINGPTQTINQNTLYAQGPIQSIKATTLFLDVPTPSNNGITLFTTAPTGCINNLPLFTNGIGTSNIKCDLYLDSPINSSCDLFIKTYEPTLSSGSLTLNVWTSGSATIFSNRSGIGLFMEQAAIVTSGLPIYINSNLPGKVSSNTSLSLVGLFSSTIAKETLYIQSPSASSVAQRLWIQGATNTFGTGTTLFTRNNYIEVFNNKILLYIQNRVTNNSGISLYTVAGNYKSSITMFIDTQVPSITNNSMSLLTNSMGFGSYFIYNGDAFSEHPFSDTTKSGQFYNIAYPTQYLVQMGIYIGAVGNGIGTPLYMSAIDRASINGHTNLFINSNNTIIGKNVPLYMESVHSTMNSINFNIGGFGQLDGGYVLGNSATLYMSRINNSYGSAQNLQINGPSGNNFNVPMFISGGTLSYGQMNLALAVSKGIGSGNQTLYTHGF